VQRSCRPFSRRAYYLWRTKIYLGDRQVEQEGAVWMTRKIELLEKETEESGLRKANNSSIKKQT
jgi:hypothetical protein